MIVELSHELGLKLVRSLLSKVVTVKCCVLSAELVGHVFVVVSYQVGQQLGSHVVVVRTWTDSWEEHGASIFVALASYQPAGKDNAEEVHANKEPSLLSALNLVGVKVHVKLRTDVTVKDGVDIFEVDSA